MTSSGWSTPRNQRRCRHNRVNELLLDRDGNLWIGTANGVAVFHPGEDYPLLDTAANVYPWRESVWKDIGGRDQGDLG